LILKDLAFKLFAGLKKSRTGRERKRRQEGKQKLQMRFSDMSFKHVGGGGGGVDEEQDEQQQHQQTRTAQTMASQKETEKQTDPLFGVIKKNKASLARDPSALGEEDQQDASSSPLYTVESCARKGDGVENLRKEQRWGFSAFGDSNQRMASREGFRLELERDSNKARNKARSLGLALMAYDLNDRHAKGYVLTDYTTLYAAIVQNQGLTSAARGLISSGGVEHVYEGLMIERPVVPYFDMEFSIEENPKQAHLIDEMTRNAIAMLTAYLIKCFPDHEAVSGITFDDWIVLDSSDQKKASRHVILRREGVWFDSLLEHALFASIVLQDFNARSAAGEEAYESLCVRRSVKIAPEKGGGYTIQLVSFVDFCVYKEFQLFRTLFSRKYNDPRVMRVARINSFGKPGEGRLENGRVSFDFFVAALPGAVVRPCHQDGLKLSDRHFNNRFAITLVGYNAVDKRTRMMGSVDGRVNVAIVPHDPKRRAAFGLEDQEVLEKGSDGGGGDGDDVQHCQNSKARNSDDCFTGQKKRKRPEAFDASSLKDDEDERKTHHQQQAMNEMNEALDPYQAMLGSTLVHVLGPGFSNANGNSQRSSNLGPKYKPSNADELARSIEKELLGQDQWSRVRNWIKGSRRPPKLYCRSYRKNGGEEEEAFRSDDPCFSPKSSASFQEPGSYTFLADGFSCPVTGSIHRSSKSYAVIVPRNPSEPSLFPASVYFRCFSRECIESPSVRSSNAFLSQELTHQLWPPSSSSSSSSSSEPCSQTIASSRSRPCSFCFIGD